MSVFFNSIPDYSMFKVFGCLAYASTLKNNRHKFQPRATKCAFIGYYLGVKGFNLLDLATRQVFVSRDVKFYEYIFLFHDPDLSIESLEPFPDIVIPSFSNAHIPIDVHDASLSDNSNNDQTQLFVPHQVVDPTSNSTSTLPNSDDNNNVHIRRSVRQSKVPSYLHDYHLNLLIHSPLPQCPTAYPLNQVISYNDLSPTYKHFALNISLYSEPHSYKQAKLYDHWKQAMAEELDAMQSNQTWFVVPLPPHKNTIGCKWVFKTKFKADGSLDKYKARLVAKGFTQHEGVDFLHTFSSVAKLTTVKVLLALAASQNWCLTQLDISNAFLNGDLLEEVYMQLPKGYVHNVEPKAGEKLVGRLHKSIYGLKQASRQWNAKFTEALLQFGFLQSKNDYSLFVKGAGSSFVTLLVYVDDIVVASPNMEIVHKVVGYLKNVFKLRDMGSLKYFLGLEVAR